MLGRVVVWLLSAAAGAPDAAAWVCFCVINGDASVAGVLVVAASSVMHQVRQRRWGGTGHATRGQCAGCGWRMRRAMT